MQINFNPTTETIRSSLLPNTSTRHIASALEVLSKTDSYFPTKGKILATTLLVTGLVALILVCFLRHKSKPAIQTYLQDVTQKDAATIIDKRVIKHSHDKVTTTDNEEVARNTQDPVTISEGVAGVTDILATAKVPDIENLEDEEELVPDVKATIAVIPGSWCIDGDMKYRFSKRLKWADGNRVEIKPTDRYIQIYASGNSITLPDANDKNGAFVLPSPLFEEIQDGSVISFYLDDKLYELTCDQEIYSHNGMSFKQALEETLADRTYPDYYLEDTNGSPVLFQHPIYTAKGLSSNTNQKKPNIKFYQSDVSVNGKYKLLRYVQDDTTIMVNVKLSTTLTKDQIYVYEVQTTNGPAFVVLIPHQPHLNAPPAIPGVEPTNVYIVKIGEVEFMPPIRHNPRLGYRCVGYQHGRYTFIPRKEAWKNCTVDYDDEGFLIIKNGN